MKKRIMIAAYTIVALLLIKFAFTYWYNEWVISKYEEGDYTENFSLLEAFNFTERYIVYYNNGNVMYQNKDYEAAIEYYEQALEEDPPEGKECPIRINLALAKLQLLGEDYLTEEKIDKTIKILKDCLDILSEEDCANDDGDGHDNRAQRLYDEIKEMLEQAQQEKEQQEKEKEEQEQQQQQQDPNQDPNGDPNDPNNQNQDPNGGNEEDEEDKKKAQEEQEKKEKRQQEIEDEMDKRMDKSNDQRQEERKKSQAQDEEWNWYYDEIPVW